MFCRECLNHHPEPDYVWANKFEKPVYWTLPDDGAAIRCKCCNKIFECSEVYLTQIPCGDRRVLCMDCIEKDWLDLAVNLGQFSD